MFPYLLFLGTAEPIGTLLTGLVLLPFLSEQILASLLAAVGGLMVFISIHELVPASREFGHEHLAVMACPPVPGASQLTSGMTSSQR